MYETDKKINGKNIVKIFRMSIMGRATLSDCEGKTTLYLVKKNLLRVWVSYGLKNEKNRWLSLLSTFFVDVFFGLIKVRELVVYDW